MLTLVLLGLLFATTLTQSPMDYLTGRSALCNNVTLLSTKLELASGQRAEITLDAFHFACTFIET